MSDDELITETQDTLAKLKKKRRNKKIVKNATIFLSIFVVCVIVLLSLIKSFSPDVDVSIGNSQSLTLNDDMNLEIKSVDERLKWIQMEDEMPSVAIRNNDEEDFSRFEPDISTTMETEDDYSYSSKTIKQAPKPSIKEINKNTIENKNSISDFRAQTTQPVKTVVPLPTASVTKVYLGNYSSLDEAMLIQQKISNQVSDAAPFIRAVDNYYIVQLGSFSTKERAENFIIKIKSLGYNPKVKYSN